MKKVVFVENDIERDVEYTDVEFLKEKNIKMVSNDKYSDYGYKTWKEKLVSILPLLITAVYLFLGFQYNMWHPMWILYFLIPLISAIVYSKKLVSMTAITFIVVGAYLGLGFGLNLWHPTWLLFFLIPISRILFNGK